MEKFFRIFDNLNEIVDISDIETYEILYMNKKALKEYGFSSLEEVRGKKCYEVLQGRDIPCISCINQQLKKELYYEWQYTSPLTKKTLGLKETIFEEKGRQYRLEIAVDLTLEEKKRKQLVEISLNHEKIINEALKRALRKENPEETIRVFLAYLGEQLNAGRTYIFEIRDDEVVDNTYEWCAPGVTKEKENLQGLPVEALKEWFDIFEKKNNIIIADLEAIKEDNPAVYAFLKPQSISTLVAGPIFHKKKIVGFFGVDNVSVELIDTTSLLLEIVCHFLTSILRRRDLFLRLKEISSHDGLTGLLNRASGERKINQLLQKNSGVFMILDLDGFKEVNDCFGHQRGDQVLIEAANILKSISRSDDVLLRLGGDEFVIFYPTSHMEKVIELKSYQILDQITEEITDGEKSVLISCSIGIAVSEKGENTFETLYPMADASLYEAKRNGKNRAVYNLNEVYIKKSATNFATD